jgi:hypothetical protein
MRVFITLSMLVITGIGWSQTTITVRPQHSKETIYKFRNGEALYADESVLELSFDGVQCEFVTIQDKNFFHHINKRRSGPTKYPKFGKQTMEYSETADKKNYIKDLATGRKYGPYDQIRTEYRLSSRGGGDRMRGFKYTKDKEEFVKWIPKGKNYGPYQKVRLIAIYKSEIYFTFERDSSQYINVNGKEIGPFDYLTYRRPYGEGKLVSYSYQKPGESEYYTTVKGKEYGPFKNRALAYETDKSWYIIDKPYKDVPGQILQANGAATATGAYIGNMQVYQDDSWLREEFVFTRENMTTAEKKTLKAQFTVPTKITTQEGEIGTFLLYESQNKLSRLKSAKHMALSVKEFVHGFDKSQLNDFPYQILYHGKTVTPAAEMNRAFLQGSANCYAYLDNQKRLYINNELTEYADVSSFNIENYPKDWTVNIHRGDTALSYKNGKLITEQRADYNVTPIYAANKKHWYAKVMINRESFLATSSSKDLYGPYNISGRQPIMFSESGRDIAVPSGGAIYINDKLIDKGFSLVYNKYNRSFMWLSVESNKLIKHTYELD